MAMHRGLSDAIQCQPLLWDEKGINDEMAELLYKFMSQLILGSWSFQSLNNEPFVTHAVAHRTNFTLSP